MQGDFLRCCSPVGRVLGVSENEGEQKVEEEKDWGPMSLVNKVAAGGHRRDPVAPVRPKQKHLLRSASGLHPRTQLPQVWRGGPNPRAGIAGPSVSVEAGGQVGAGFRGWSERYWRPRKGARGEGRAVQNPHRRAAKSGGLSEDSDSGPWGPKVGPQEWTTGSVVGKMGHERMVLVISQVIFLGQTVQIRIQELAIVK